MTVLELNAVFGKNVKRYRKQKGYGLREFARMIGVSKTQVYNWQRGRQLAGGQNLVRIARLFEVEVWQLFYTDANAVVKNSAVKRD